MIRRELNAKVRGELHALVAQEVLTVEQGRALFERYPVGRWNLISLTRWFTILGAVAMAAGVVVLAPRWVDLHHLVEGSLTLATAGLLAGGVWLRTRMGLVRTGRALELLGAFALEGLSFAFATFHATGSDNWPALVGIVATLLVLLAYALKNPLVLVDACVNLFIFFGGETGYVSGTYWLGMTFPVRYVLAGAAAALLGWAHVRLENRWQHFAAVWAHVGLLVVNLALWFLALFGYFTDHVTWDDNTDQRLAFSLLWALAAGGLLYFGMARKVRLLRGYGLTFLIINGFTFYAQFVAANSAELWFVHLLVLGGSLVGLGVWVERERAAQRTRPSAGTQT
jgi:hypothetical protein